MAANIDAEIRQIQQASRGEQVRDAIVSALIAINDSDGSATRELVNEIVDAAIKALDVSAVGGNGKYIKSISETDGKISANEETMDTQPIKDSVKAITSGGVFSLKESLQQNFQAGVDSIYDAVVAKGSTPASKSLSDVVQGIEDIPTGGQVVIDHTDNWVRSYNIGPMELTSTDYLWTDGDDLYYSNQYVDLIFNPTNLSFEPITITVDVDDVKVIGSRVTNFNGNAYLYYSSNRYVFDKVTKTFKKTTINYSYGSSEYKSYFWNEGVHIYYSRGTTQLEYDKVSGTWSEKVWNGLTSFNGWNIWTDGSSIYYSNGSSQQYVLDKSTSTWVVKTWSGYSNFSGVDIWTDGEKYYYSYSSTQYELDSELGVWFPRTWNINFNGYYVWTDGENIYYSNGSTHYILDKETSTWTQKSWGGLTSFNAPSIWTDGENIYYSNGSTHYILDKETSTWTQKSWGGLTSFNGIDIWTDGEKYYDNYYILVIDEDRWESVYQDINSYDIWTDGENIYYSYESRHYILNPELGTWVSKTWSGLTSFQGRYIWTDGENIYYSNGNTQRVLDKSTSTWNAKTWSGLTYFYGNQVCDLNGDIYVTTYVNTAYLLDKNASAWNVVNNWNPITFGNVYQFNGEYYGFVSSGSGGSCVCTNYKYIPSSNAWGEILMIGPIVLSVSDIWRCDDAIYYSSGTKQLVYNKETKIWSKIQWNGITSFSGRYIWTDGENYYYSSDSTQYVLNKERFLWYTKVWTGLTNFSASQIWNDDEYIYRVDGETVHRLEKSSS